MRGEIGHNRGPSLEPGYRYRLGLWRKARADLIPKTIPVEVVRRRVRRAAELGLNYKAYASIRASTGRDVIVFLFSDNALRIRQTHLKMAKDRFDKLSGLRDCAPGVAVHPPVSPAQVLDANALLTFGGKAPGLSQSWSSGADGLRHLLRESGLPADGVLVVGETGLERDWCAALRAAGFLWADRYFVPERC